MLHLLLYSLSSQYAGFANDKVRIQSTPWELDKNEDKIKQNN